ncbi:hypothetical protein VMCG_01782 [Cytospora schulzeri]|uniref:Tetracenomycin polyketide synthesis O-methyltransferase TcmP n=1 Tax=Cytospora schulzeri TaxID=448051 RepID=A0A423X375_9PEZI|nr:hypothetical protein VMCG_01782 [Valsa malicola]
MAETTPKEEIRLTGAEEMLLPVVFVKAVDAESDKPILGDPFSQQLLDRCAIDYSKSHFSRDKRYVTWVANRAKQFDNWCQVQQSPRGFRPNHAFSVNKHGLILLIKEFLNSHHGQPVTVLHIACGLDCRVLRVDRGPDVRWIDVDLPLAVNLRRRLIPQPPGDYTLRTLHITKEGWLDDIPADRPTLVIAEGLLMYLEPAEGEKIFKDVVGHFDQGEIFVDTVGSLTTRFTSVVKILRSSGSVFKWGIDDARKQIEPLHPKLRLKTQISWGAFMKSHPPVFGELGTSIASLFPRFKNNLQLLRFNF